MAEFTYNNTKNTSTSYNPFKLNYDYHPKILFEDKADSRSKSCSANELAEELKKLREIYCQSLLYV